jgi:hypothetical protein
MFNRTPEYDLCEKRVILEQPVCYESHSRTVNETALALYHPSLYCEKRFDIPSDNQSAGESGIPARNTFVPRSTVESLYCDIMQLFGGKCE